MFLGLETWRTTASIFCFRTKRTDVFHSFILLLSAAFLFYSHITQWISWSYL